MPCRTGYALDQLERSTDLELDDRLQRAEQTVVVAAVLPSDDTGLV